MSALKTLLAKTTLGGWIAYNLITAILYAPVLYAFAQQSVWMAAWVGICSLVGVALSVIVPVFVWRKVS